MIEELETSDIERPATSDVENREDIENVEESDIEESDTSNIAESEESVIENSEDSEVDESSEQFYSEDNEETEHPTETETDTEVVAHELEDTVVDLPELEHSQTENEDVHSVPSEVVESDYQDCVTHQSASESEEEPATLVRPQPLRRSERKRTRPKILTFDNLGSPKTTQHHYRVLYVACDDTDS